MFTLESGLLINQRLPSKGRERSHCTNQLNSSPLIYCDILTEFPTRSPVLSNVTLPCVRHTRTQDDEISQWIFSLTRLLYMYSRHHRKVPILIFCYYFILSPFCLLFCYHAEFKHNHCNYFWYLSAYTMCLHVPTALV